VIKQVAEQHQDMSEIIENESILVKEIAEVIIHEYLLIQAANNVDLTELIILYHSFPVVFDVAGN